MDAKDLIKRKLDELLRILPEAQIRVFFDKQEPLCTVEVTPLECFNDPKFLEFEFDLYSSLFQVDPNFGLLLKSSNAIVPLVNADYVLKSTDLHLKDLKDLLKPALRGLTLKIKELSNDKNEISFQWSSLNSQIKVGEFKIPTNSKHLVEYERKSIFDTIRKSLGHDSTTLTEIKLDVPVYKLELDKKEEKHDFANAA